MKIFNKTLNNKEQGITLIALVVTIIVLLILAGVTISIAIRDGGIIKRAKDSKQITGSAEVVEKAKLAIIDKITENQGEGITKQQLKTILSNYFDNVESLNLPDDLSNSDIKLNANQQNGGYKDIPLAKIYNGTFKTQEVATAYAIGDYVTINGEGFYVIEDSPVSQPRVKLLTAKFVNISTNRQDDNASAVIFDDSTNVYANSYIKTKVESYASSLGIDVVSSGLLSCADIDNLCSETSLAIAPGEFGYTSYWLDDVGCDEGFAWMGCIDGMGGTGNYDWEDVNELNGHQVHLRPFIEVLKADIS